MPARCLATEDEKSREKKSVSSNAQQVVEQFRAFVLSLRAAHVSGWRPQSHSETCFSRIVDLL